MSTAIDHPQCSAYCNRYFHFHTNMGTITKDLLIENQKNQKSISVLVLILLHPHGHQSKTLHGRVTLTLFCTTMVVVCTLVTTIFYGLIGIVFVLERSYLLLFPDQLQLLDKQIRRAELTLEEQKRVLKETADLETPLRELASRIVSFQNALDKIDQQHALTVSTLLDKSKRLEERAQEAQKVFEWILKYLRDSFFVGDMEDIKKVSLGQITNFKQMADRARELERAIESEAEIEQEIEKLNQEIDKFNSQLSMQRQQLSQLLKDGALAQEAYQHVISNLTDQLQRIEEEKNVQLINPRQVMV